MTQKGTPLDVTSNHTAKLEVPFAPGAEQITVVTQVSPTRRIIFSASSSVSPEDAARKVREFLQSAAQAASA